MECGNREKLKWKDDQLLKESGQLEINTQDKIWRLLTNMPMSSRKKTQYRRKVSTKLIISIEEVIYDPPSSRNVGENRHIKKYGA